jgi:hypothetical protein
VAETLDSVLKARLRAVLDDRPTTEAELRKLAEEGRACRLIMAGELRRNEERLVELGDDPASSLVEAAACLRRVNELRPGLAELDGLLADLEARAREFRTSWLTGSSGRAARTSA